MMIIDPRLSVIPLPTLEIEVASIMFDMEVKSATAYVDIPSVTSEELEVNEP